MESSRQQSSGFMIDRARGGMNMVAAALETHRAAGSYQMVLGDLAALLTEYAVGQASVSQITKTGQLRWESLGGSFGWCSVASGRLLKLWSYL